MVLFGLTFVILQHLKIFLNYLENINEEDYLKVLKQHSSDLIEYDEGNNKFKNLIHSLLRT